MVAGRRLGPLPRRPLLVFLFVVLAVILSEDVVVRGQDAEAEASDSPSDVPSEVPVGMSDVPSELGTESPSAGGSTTTPGGGPGEVTVPPGETTSAPNFVCVTAETCGLGQCVSFATMDEIRSCVESIDGQGKLCMCPFTFSTTGGNCPTAPQAADGEAGAVAAGIVVSAGQDVTLECDSDFGTKCIFACPDAVLDVQQNARLTLEGRSLTELTGGTSYSRIFVDEGGEATIRDATFRE